MKILCFFVLFYSCPLFAQFFVPSHDLLSSVINGNREKIKEYVESGADVNQRHRQDGKTPLHFAYWFAARDTRGVRRQPGETFEPGSSDIVKYLLEHGADPSIRDNQGRLPTDYQEFFDQKGNRTDREGYRIDKEGNRTISSILTHKVKNWCGSFFK